LDRREFHYELPQSLIAAYPSGDRQESRLLVIRRATGELMHSVFSELGDFLEPGDLLVLNDTKVFPARLRGAKESGGKAEVLLLERFPGTRSFWIALIDAAKKPPVGSRIVFGEDFFAEVIGDIGLILEELAPRMRGRASADWDVGEIERFKRTFSRERAALLSRSPLAELVELARDATPAGTIAIFDRGVAPAAMAWQWLYHPDQFGLLNSLLGKLGLPPPQKLTDTADTSRAAR